MPQSRTRAVGLDGHQEPIAVAYVAQAHEAEGGSRGSIGTRQCDIDTLSRRLQATRPHLVLVYAAGPCGYWL
jgi:hypothetical protein